MTKRYQPDDPVQVSVTVGSQRFDVAIPSTVDTFAEDLGFISSALGLFAAQLPEMEDPE